MTEYNQFKHYGVKTPVDLDRHAVNRYDIRYAINTDGDEEYIRDLLSQANMEKLSQKVSQILFEKLKRNIKVPIRNIRNTLETILHNKNCTSQSELERYTISAITYQIIEEYEIAQNNSKLTVWVTNYDGDHGILAHPKIKLNRRRTNRLAFNFNY